MWTNSVLLFRHRVVKNDQFPYLLYDPIVVDRGPPVYTPEGTQNASLTEATVKIERPLQKKMFALCLKFTKGRKSPMLV